MKFSETQPSVRQGPPKLGEHTETTLEELGLSREEIERMRDLGTI